MQEKNEAAVSLGKKSAAKRFEGKTEKEISEYMSKVRGGLKVKKLSTSGR